MSEQHSVALPQLGESVTEATILRWVKAVGDAVAAGEVIVEVSTDKVDTEVVSPHAGVLIEITVAQDQTAQVGDLLAVIGMGQTAGDPISPAPDKPHLAQPTLIRPSPVLTEPATPAPAPGPPRALKTFLSPLVRKLAAERDVDLTALTGSGRNDRITKADVLTASERGQAVVALAIPATQAAASVPVARVATEPVTPFPPASQSARGETRTLSRLRRLMARRMVESLRTSAQLTSVVEVDVSNLVRLRNQIRNQDAAAERLPLTFLPFFAKATIETLRQFPAFNASLDIANGTVHYYAHQDLAIAVDTERGLVAPVIRNAGDLSISGLARAIADATTRARSNSLQPDELATGTFTLTNTGSRGALFDTPIINQPQVAILGTGVITKRPVAVTDKSGSDSIAIRSMMYLSLTYDHQLIDGADAARFLVATRTRLESRSLGQDLLGSVR